MSDKTMSYDLYFIGDSVVIEVDKENRDWGYNPCPDGTKGKIVEFSEIHYSRISNFGQKPGVYSNKCWVDVELETGKTINISSHNLYLENQVEAKARLKEIQSYNKDGISNHRFNKAFLRDLPETRLWEDDVVRVHSKRGRGTYETEYGKKLVVSRIEYDYIGQTRDDGSPMPMYQVSNELNGGWYMSFEDEELELIERGKVWKKFHGEPIQFKDLEEEANFARILGEDDQLRNPKTKLYTWSPAEIYEALKNGTGDAFSASSGIMGMQFSSMHHSLYKFRDPDLGKRVREFTLANINFDEIEELSKKYEENRKEEKEKLDALFKEAGIAPEE